MLKLSYVRLMLHPMMPWLFTSLSHQRTWLISEVCGSRFVVMGLVYSRPFSPIKFRVISLGLGQSYHAIAPVSWKEFRRIWENIWNGPIQNHNISKNKTKNDKKGAYLRDIYCMTYIIVKNWWNIETHISFSKKQYYTQRATDCRKQPFLYWNDIK